MQKLFRVKLYEGMVIFSERVRVGEEVVLADLKMLEVVSTFETYLLNYRALKPRRQQPSSLSSVLCLVFKRVSRILSLSGVMTSLILFRFQDYRRGIGASVHQRI